jgi:hypothetical protein
MDLITVSTFITLNGDSPKATKTVVECDTIVKLSGFVTGKNFNWYPFCFKNTILNLENIVIYDDDDLNSLEWFLYNKFNVDMTKSYIGFEMLRKLADKLDIISSGWSLKLRLPWGGGSRELECLEYSKQLFDKLGVKY